MTAPVQEGDVLGGKFRVERVLGTGGMGVVVAAYHLQLDQRVALKFLLPAAAKEKDVVARFAREARAAAKIQSEHVARVIDVGTLETGAPYMVMEYLEGEDLDLVLKARGTLPIHEAVRHVLQACEALAEAHALGIVHRDLKPANLFLAERSDGTVSIKVLDFGISKVAPDGSAADPSLTKTHAVMGSPMYMSPEQLRSARDVDARADIWALGILLYEMLCGAGPFSTGSVAEVCAAILKDTPVPPSATRSEVPPGLEAIVLKCLEKDVKKRYSNVAELALALLSYGPPGSELSIERISRVLQKGARSQRSAGLQGPASKSESVRPAPPVSVELAATKLMRPSLVAALADTSMEGESTPRPAPAPAPAQPPPDAGATHSASSVSAWNAKPVEKGKSKLGIAVALLALLGAGGGSVYWFAYRPRPAGEEAVVAPPIAPPSAEATAAPSASALPEPSAAASIEPPPPPEPTEAPSAAASASAKGSAAPVDPRKLPWVRPRSTASADASSSASPGAATSSPSSAPSSQSTAAPTASPKSASTSTPTSAPSSKPTAKPK